MFNVVVVGSFLREGKKVARARGMLAQPNFEKEPSGDVQRPPKSLPFPPTSREDLWHDGNLYDPHAVKALYTLRNIENSDPRRKHRIEMKFNTHNDTDERFTFFQKQDN
ncbi:hypothetical protein TNCV_624931 [Trichonephila clavipes]|nr:hypothetical protein TNCV_624931 [Trichonephila clavipes]